MAKTKTKQKGPKGDKLMRDALSIELNEELAVPDPDGGVDKKGKPRTLLIKKFRLVARALVNAGMKGEVDAIKEINNRMDGRLEPPRPQPVAIAVPVPLDVPKTDERVDNVIQLNDPNAVSRVYRQYVTSGRG